MPHMLFFCRMKSITGQWLDKSAVFHHESFKRAGNFRSLPGPAALSGTLVISNKIGRLRNGISIFFILDYDYG